MRKYFCLQFKRMSGSFLVILAVTALLVLGISVIVSELSLLAMNGEEKKQFQVALCGDTDGDYIELGLNALETIDDARFSLEILMLEEDEAAWALASGEISAYVILPEDFIDNAIQGNIDKVTFVTSPGQSGIVTMFKNEITHLITDLVVYSEKGTYAIYDALRENGDKSTAYEYMNVICIEYAELVFSRGDVYSYKSLGISEGLDVLEYYVCALSVLLVMLVGIPFAFVHIRGDRSLDRVLRSRGYSELSVIGCEYAVHSICLCVLYGASVALMVGYFALNAGSPIDMSELLGYELILRMIPVILMLAAFDLLIFETQNNIVSGVLTHFFLTLSILYASGCLYPVYALPSVMQTASAILPAGLSRGYLGGVFTFEPRTGDLIGVVLYAISFFLCAYALRVYRTREQER